MNKYTQDFHNAEFSGITITQTADEISRDLWSTTQIPFVDTNLIFDYESTHRWLKEHNHLFTEVRSLKRDKIKQTRYRQDWFATSRADGWKSLYVKGTPYKDNDIVETTETSTENVELDKHEDAVPELVDFFEKNELPLLRLWIFRMSPGGWLQPHRDDIVEKTPALAQFWMPLHDFPECLKIYPHGYLPHQAGHLYLFNNRDFIHSVINQTDQDRYVAVGELDYTFIEQEKSNQISELLIKQWF